MTAPDRIVIVDTSVILYAVQLDSANCLHRLYGEVTVPGAVYDEILHKRAPTFLKSWVRDNSSWVQVATVKVEQDEALALLDAGEREAIALAQQNSGSLLIIDEYDGRQEAIRRGISVTGLLGVVRDAAALELLDFESAMVRLREVGFRFSHDLEARVRRQYQAGRLDRGSARNT